MDVCNSLKKYILFSGIGFFLLGVVVIFCDAMTNAENEESLKQRQSATAYWVGLPVGNYTKTAINKYCDVFIYVIFGINKVMNTISLKN